jgi:alkylhydroperoxidase/carboxymuconolactone decarboxylase family protein YurZ
VWLAYSHLYSLSAQALFNFYFSQFMRSMINQGLDAVLTISEIKEVIVQIYAYAGFPRSLNALHTFMKALEHRKNKGITMLKENCQSISGK